MMEMFKKTGELKPDSLIVSPDFPILAEGIGLKAGYGVLKRGSLVMRGTDKAGYIAGSVVKTKDGEGESATESSMDMKVFGILTDDFDTGIDISGENIPATVYQTGEFNRAAVVVSGEHATVEDYEDEMKHAGLFLRSVKDYG